MYDEQKLAELPLSDQVYTKMRELLEMAFLFQGNV